MYILLLIALNVNKFKWITIMSDFFIFSWDIMNTIYIDTEIENERDEAMTSATLLLMRNMHGNGDVNKDVMDKATQKFKR